LPVPGIKVSVFITTIREEEVAADAPELIASNSDENNDDDHGEYGISMAAAARGFD
jgi:hypothetical protein